AGLLLHVHIDVADLVRRPVAVDRRVDDGVVHVEHLLLRPLVPAAGVFLVRRVEVGVGPEGGEECRLVVGRSAHPAVGHPCPLVVASPSPRSPSSSALLPNTSGVPGYGVMGPQAPLCGPGLLSVPYTRARPDDLGRRVMIERTTIASPSNSGQNRSDHAAGRA